MIEFIFASLAFAVLLGWIWEGIQDVYAQYRKERYTKMTRMDGPMLSMVMFMFTGCATQPTVHVFPGLNLNVVRTSQGNINTLCRRPNSTKDDGTVLMTTTDIKGCYVRSDRTIYLSSYYEDVELLLHELCHFDASRTRAECGEEF